MDIKEEIKKCNDTIKENQEKIKYLKSCCPHEHTEEKHYYNYDEGNMCTIVCLDCYSILFDEPLSFIDAFNNSKPKSCQECKYLHYRDGNLDYENDWYLCEKLNIDISCLHREKGKFIPKECPFN